MGGVRLLLGLEHVYITNAPRQPEPTEGAEGGHPETRKKQSDQQIASLGDSTTTQSSRHHAELPLLASLSFSAPFGQPASHLI